MKPALSLLLIVIFSSVSNAQESEALDLSKLPNSVELFQPSNRVLVLKGGFNEINAFAIAPSTNLMDFLRDQNNQQHVELTTQQKKEFKELRQELKTELANLHKRLGKLGEASIPAEQLKKLNQTIKLKSKELNDEFNEKAREILVPHQQKSVDALLFSQLVEFRGFHWTVTNTPFRDRLKTSEKQKKTITEIEAKANEEIKAAQAELQKKIAEIKAKSKKEILKTFDAKQRKEIEKLEKPSSSDEKQKSSKIK